MDKVRRSVLKILLKLSWDINKISWKIIYGLILDKL